MPTLLPPRSFDSAINHQRWYIATEFNRYFPDATEITVDHTNDGETILVRICGADNLRDEFRMDIGSDDDYYVFENDFGSIITVPLESVA